MGCDPNPPKSARGRGINQGRLLFKALGNMLKLSNKGEVIRQRGQHLAMNPFAGQIGLFLLLGDASFSICLTHVQAAANT